MNTYRRHVIGCAGIAAILILIVGLALFEIALVQDCWELHPYASWRACWLGR